MVTEGVRTRDVVKRISGTSFRKGQQLAQATLEQEFKAKLEDLSQEAGFVKREELSGQFSSPPKPAGPDQMSTEIAKAVAPLKGEITKLQNEIKTQRENDRERLITERIKSTIAELGFDDPNDVLLLARQEASFVFDPSDGETLIAVKPGDRAQPLSGDGTYTTVKDYFQSFANTTRGMRYRKVPEGARAGAGISGIPGVPIQEGILSDKSLNAALHKLGA